LVFKNSVWSLQITVRAITKLRGDYQLRKKMFCLQLVVMLCKLQYLILYDQLDGIKMGGEYPINHTIYKQSEFFIWWFLSIYLSADSRSITKFRY